MYKNPFVVEVEDTLGFTEKLTFDVTGAPG